jgi:hypothetical protein
MVNFRRREFLQASFAASLLRVISAGSATNSPAKISEAGNTILVKGNEYTWEWSQEKDEFRLLDRWGLEIVQGRLQPAVVVQLGEPKGVRRAIAGKPVSREVHDSSGTIRYQGVNRGGQLSLTWRVEDDGFWLEPVSYTTPNPEDVVSLSYFAEGTGESAKPSLTSDYLVLPGTNESSQFSPILTSGEIGIGLRQTCWLGHSWTGDPNAFQVQDWGLPAHYFCGFHRSPFDFQKTPRVDLQSTEPQDFLNAFCCGLAELPNGDMLFEMAHNRFSPIISYRSDLWQHLRGPGNLSLGARLYWAVGANFYEAIRGYYLGLVKGGVIRKKINSPRKNAVALAPSFCTFGEQGARDHMNMKFDEPTLLGIYEEVKKSGMKAKLFVVDGYWEGKYGNLRHSVERFRVEERHLPVTCSSTPTRRIIAACSRPTWRTFPNTLSRPCRVGLSKVPSIITTSSIIPVLKRWLVRTCGTSGRVSGSPTSGSICLRKRNGIPTLTPTGGACARR